MMKTVSPAVSCQAARQEQIQKGIEVERYSRKVEYVYMAADKLRFGGPTDVTGVGVLSSYCQNTMYDFDGNTRGTPDGGAPREKGT